MRMRTTLTMIAICCLVPSIATAQQKKVICADNVIVTSDAECANHGGVQKPGGLNKVGKQINKAAIDVKEEAERTPGNVEKGAKNASEETKKTVHPTQYRARCKDGTEYVGRSKKNACKNHGGVTKWK